MLCNCWKTLDSDPEQESGTAWSLPANVCGGFIPHLIWGRNDGKRAFLPFSQFINNENQLKEKT
jgi:hypothetical protein